MTRWIPALLLAFCASAAAWQTAVPVSAQVAKKERTTKRKSTRKGKKPPSVQAIDSKVQRFQQSFLREAIELSRSYEDAGQLSKSRQMLQLILKVNPETKGVRKKIKQIDEQMLSANELDFEVDTSRGWSQPVAIVYRDRPFRVQADGDFHFVTSLSVGPAGFPVADTVRDMAAGFRCAALIGVVVAPTKSGKKPKPGKPFLVGRGGEIVPREDGLLFLKINAPTGHKCTGRLRVRISGNVRKP